MGETIMVHGFDGEAPWSRRKVIWWVAVPVMALLIIIATWWAVDHIEETLAADARADLVNAGILPAGSTTADAEAAVDHGLLRSFSVEAETAAPATETDVDSEPTSVTDTAATTEQLDADIDRLQSEFDGLAVEIRENVVFESGSAVLSATAAATLDEVVVVLQTHTDPVVDIAGHTDNTGDPEANRALPQSRAEAVVAHLVDAGIDTDRVRARGAGDSEPIASNDTAEGRAENRRVALTAPAEF